MYKFILILCACGNMATAQSTQVPYRENFENVIVPSLPPGWSTSANRSSSGDFSVTSSTPFSGANAALSTNASIPQYLVTPLLDFTSISGAELTFRER